MPHGDSEGHRGGNENRAARGATDKEMDIQGTGDDNDIDTSIKDARGEIRATATAIATATATLPLNV